MSHSNQTKRCIQDAWKTSENEHVRVHVLQRGHELDYGRRASGGAGAAGLQPPLCLGADGAAPVGAPVRLAGCAEWRQQGAAAGQRTCTLCATSGSAVKTVARNVHLVAATCGLALGALIGYHLDALRGYHRNNVSSSE